MYKTVSLCLIGNSWCDAHDASIHQIFGSLLHVIHTLSRDILPLQSCYQIIHLFQSQKAFSDPLQLLLAIQQILFKLCLWCHSKLGHALQVKSLLPLYLNRQIWCVLIQQTFHCYFQQLSKAFLIQNKSNDQSDTAHAQKHRYLLMLSQDSFNF